MQFTGEGTQIMTKPVGKKVLNIKENMTLTHKDFSLVFIFIYLI